MDGEVNNYYEKRLDKLEEGQEKIQNKLEKFHEDIVETKTDLKIFTERVTEHVASDKKIASEIEPLVQILPNLKNMVEDHEYKKTRDKKFFRNMKRAGIVLGVISTVVGIAVKFQYIAW